MAALIQWAVLVLFTAGLGYWTWFLTRKPVPGRALTWLWCGLAGFALGLLVLQALVYADCPLRKTVPWLAAVAGVGVVLLAVEVWRVRQAISGPRRREILGVLGAGLAAGLVHATSLAGIGSDRFLGKAQIDHVNYVATAQFLVDEPFSTDLRGIGLRPWLWRALELKDQRITECIAVGTVAVLARADAQRVWGATAVFFTVLLAMALAGMWRAMSAVPAWAAGFMGWVGAAIPVVTGIYLVGFFSQLAALFVFPALIATCRAGALPRGRALVFATILLGYLAATYTEFWPIGVAVAGGAMLGWPLKPLARVACAGTAAVGSLVLTGAYITTVPEALFYRTKSVGQLAESLGGFVPDGITWLGWGRNFFAAFPAGEVAAGLLLLAGLVLAMVFQPAHRRWFWVAALAGPAALAVWFFLQTPLPEYAIYKLLGTFSPIFPGLAALGLLGAAGRIGRGPRRGAMVLLGLAGLWAVGSAVAGHLDLVRESRGPDRERLEKFWAARGRAEQAGGAVYLVENGNKLIGAWLAYFARASEVYYDLPAVSDRRVPTTAVAFRRIPAGTGLTWLDLDRSGPVNQREPSPGLVLQGMRSSFEINQRQVFVLGGEARVILTRAEGFSPGEKEFALECGLLPMPGRGACEVIFREGDVVVGEVHVTGAQPVSLRLRARPGRNVYTIQARPAGVAGAADNPNQDLVMLQALSLERVDLPGWSRDE